MIDYQQLKHFDRDKKFSIALELYQAGEIYDAMSVCGLIVDDSPRDYDAIYLYASILQDSDKNGYAELMYKQCTEIDPNRYEGWLGRGTAIKDPDRSDEAIGYFIKAILIKPDNVAASANICNNL